MNDDNNRIVSPETEEEKENSDIQEILQEIPDDILFRVIADRIQQEPKEEVRKVVQTVSEHAFSGPLPPPSMLNQYDSIQDGFADRIISMAESEQSHRQSLENKSVEAAIKTESRGQNYALAISLLIITGALYLIDSGKEVSGSLLAGGTLTGLAYIFITGKKKDSDSDSSS